MKILKLLFVALLLLSACDSKPNKHDWQQIGSQGVAKFVYISPEGLADRSFLEDVLGHLYVPNQINDILFFDSKTYTPSSFPMSDEQMMHWKAQYNYNPNNGYEKFAFFEVTDPAQSPPDLKSTEVDIRPKK